MIQLTENEFLLLLSFAYRAGALGEGETTRAMAESRESLGLQFARKMLGTWKAAAKLVRSAE
jgi:hypothetical protein